MSELHQLVIMLKKGAELLGILAQVFAFMARHVDDYGWGSAQSSYSKRYITPDIIGILSKLGANLS